MYTKMHTELSTYIYCTVCDGHLRKVGLDKGQTWTNTSVSSVPAIAYITFWENLSDVCNCITYVCNLTPQQLGYVKKGCKQECKWRNIVIWVVVASLTYIWEFLPASCLNWFCAQDPTAHYRKGKESHIAPHSSEPETH